MPKTLVINTDTRHADPADAYSRIRAIIGRYEHYKPRHIFKKVDSTLRGNIGAEIDAAMDASGATIACLAPATPRNGRTVVDGVCYINGIALNETEIAHDPLAPVLFGDIREIVGTQSSRKACLLPLETLYQPVEHIQRYIQQKTTAGFQVFIPDAESVADLQRTLEVFGAIEEKTLFVGAAGLFHARDQLIRKNQIETTRNTVEMHDRFLFVVGSLMGVTKLQVQALEEDENTVEVTLPTETAVNADTEALDVLVGTIVHAYRGAHAVLLKTEGLQLGDDMASEAAMIGTALGYVVDAVMRQVTLHALVMTGGDTAMRILKQLNIGQLALADEVLPGIPAATAAYPHRKGEDFICITKAGSYGDPDALKNVLDYLMNDKENVCESVI